MSDVSFTLSVTSEYECELVVVKVNFVPLKFLAAVGDHDSLAVTNANGGQVDAEESWQVTFTRT